MPIELTLSKPFRICGMPIAAYPNAPTHQPPIIEPLKSHWMKLCSLDIANACCDDLKIISGDLTPSMMSPDEALSDKAQASSCGGEPRALCAQPM